MEYTQEQIDKIIADTKLEATKGLFTEDDLEKRVTSEVDRRVETGIQKGIETHRTKWEKEALEKANLSAEDLAQKKLQEQMEEIANREREIARRTNTLNAKDLLAEAEVPKAKYEELLDMLVTDDSDATNTNVNKFIDVFKSTKTEIETQLKSSMSTIKHPDASSGGDSVNKDTFAKMGYADKVKFKAENPDLYKTFIQ